MLRGLYQAATGMVAQELRQEVIGNNLINSNSNGFKSQAATLHTFPEMLLYRLQGGRAAPVGHYSNGVMLERTYNNWEPGLLEETGVSSHLALLEPGADALPNFFSVWTGEGEAYTRNGEFRIDSEGYLVSSEGYFLQGFYGDIYVGDEDFVIDHRGQVMVDGQVIDQLQIVTFAEPDLLQRQGNSLFISPPGVQPLTAANYQVRQGWLERANVDATRELVDMMAAHRAFAANQNVVQAVDQLLGKSVNEVGSIR